MPQSLTQVYLHIIFHIKKYDSPLRIDDLETLCPYMGSVIKSCDSIPLMINGTNDHIHILCTLSKTTTISKLVQQIKQHSSRWLKRKDSFYRVFEWQSGYGVFSVSSSLLKKTKLYIANQQEHHRKRTFKKEYILFLKEYEVEYNEKYLF
ncbi:MAG: transposase [Tannerellaceae bacterium]|nr:transposase [Tannerellaceae bacterium]